MKKGKRMVSIFLALVMIVSVASVMAVPASAASQLYGLSVTKGSAPEVKYYFTYTYSGGIYTFTIISSLGTGTSASRLGDYTDLKMTMKITGTGKSDSTYIKKYGAGTAWTGNTVNTNTIKLAGNATDTVTISVTSTTLSKSGIFELTSYAIDNKSHAPSATITLKTDLSNIKTNGSFYVVVNTNIPCDKVTVELVGTGTIKTMDKLNGAGTAVYDGRTFRALYSNLAAKSQTFTFKAYKGSTQVGSLTKTFTVTK